MSNPAYDPFGPYSQHAQQQQQAAREAAQREEWRYQDRMQDLHNQNMAAMNSGTAIGRGVGGGGGGGGGGGAAMSLEASIGLLGAVTVAYFASYVGSDWTWYWWVGLFVGTWVLVASLLTWSFVEVMFGLAAGIGVMFLLARTQQSWPWYWWPACFIACAAGVTGLLKWSPRTTKFVSGVTLLIVIAFAVLMVGHFAFKYLR